MQNKNFEKEGKQAIMRTTDTLICYLDGHRCGKRQIQIQKDRKTETESKTRQTDRQKNKQTERKTHRQTDRQTDRRTDRQRNTTELNLLNQILSNKLATQNEARA